MAIMVVQGSKGAAGHKGHCKKYIEPEVAQPEQIRSTFNKNNIN